MEWTKSKVFTVIVNVCRFVLSLMLVVSGFVKAVDPVGSMYKLGEYASAFSVEIFSDEWLLFFGIFQAVLEFLLGVFLLMGVYRWIIAYAVPAVMLFFTALTAIIYYGGDVKDCGCFGDAVVLTHWETFWKNVVLLAMSIVVLKWRKRIFPLVTTRFDWLIALYGFIYIFCMTIYCYQELPIFDFRPYHVGADIRQGMEIPEGKEPTEYETRFVLQKEGVKKEFTLENYPDSTWTFVDSRTVVKKQGYEPPIKDFSMMSYQDGEDITDRVLADEGYTFLLVAHQLRLADESKMDLINELYDYSLEHGYAFYCLTASSDEDILQWQENTGAEYPFCLMDDITLKTMIRSNPGLMLLKGGKVVRKLSVDNFPDEYQLTDSLDRLPLVYEDEQSMLSQALEVMAWFVIPLFMVCLIDLSWELYRRKRRKQNEMNE